MTIHSIQSTNGRRRRTNPTAKPAFCLLVLATSLSIAATNLPGVPSGITVFGRPMLVVASADVSPLPGKENLFPQLFELKLRIANIGNVSASQILMTLPENKYINLEKGSPTFGLNWIGAGASRDITLTMLLDGADPGGRVQPVFHFDYYKFTDDEDMRYSNDEPVRLSFGAQGWNQPSLLVSSFSTSPENPAPGDSFTLEIKLANVSSGEARQIQLRLGGTDGPQPFALVGKSNVGYVERTAASQTATVSFPMLVDGETTAGIYPVQVTITYQNLLGEERTEDEVIYLKVRTLPALQANLIGEPPIPLLVGESFDLPIEVINIGLQTLNISMIELRSEDLVIRNGSIYSGPLDGSTSTSLPATAVAEKAGLVQAQLVVHYLDEYNQPQSWVHAFTFQVEEKAAPSAGSSPQPAEEGNILQEIVKAILAFLGFGG